MTTPQEDVIKEVVKNEMENNQNITTENKKIILTDKINENLISNSLINISDFNRKLIQTPVEQIQSVNNIQNEVDIPKSKKINNE